MKVNLHKTYYLLAIIDVITIMITLFLAYSIYRTYDESFKKNEQWMQRSFKYDALTDLAIEANGPGNNVFDSRNVAKESKYFEEITTKIKSLTVFLIKDGQEQLGEHPEITKRLKNFTVNLEKANKLTYQIFSLIEQNKTKEAGEIMSKMDSEFHSALLEISKLRNKVRTIQQVQLLEYHNQAKDIFYKEFYVAGFILCLVGLILFFGQKIKASFEGLLIELDRQNNKLSDSEAKLKAILNTQLESVILIDAKGKIEYMNPATERMFDYASEELLGKNIKELMPESHAKYHDNYLKKYFDSKHKKVLGTIREIQGKRKGGGSFRLSLV